MAKVMPVAIRDETGAFIRQMAQGNEAMARMYAQLLARYEERLANQEFQREQMQYREGMADRRSADADQRWYDRTNYAHNLRYPQPAQQPNLLGPGASGVPNPMAPAATPSAAPTSSAPAARPSVYTIDNNPFRSGAGTGTPAAPAPQAALSGADHTEFSAQSRKPLPTVEQPPRTPRREPQSPTQLPTQPRAPTARTAATRPQAAYLDVDQKWLDLMHVMEDKYNLPRGTMMTAYGMENGGGRQFGKNPRSSAEGIFQFTKELRDEYKLTDQDIYNPAKMIPAAAMNMRRNADILEQNYKVKLPLTAEAVPMFVGLHQWGSGAGPRIVAAYLQNPDVPMTQIMGTHRDKNGNVIPNYNVLANNGQNPYATVRDALKNKSAPYLNAYMQQFPDHANQAPGKYVSTPAPPPQQQQQQPQVGDPNAPRPPGNVPPQQHDTMGTSPRLVRAVRGGAELALPEGYTIEQTSGARPHGRSSSHHHRGNAGDFRIITPTGERIPHSGPDYTGLYTRLARGVKTWVRENDPGAEKYIGYGGAFETSRGSGRADTMHYDWGGSRGRLHPDVQFANLKPLEPHERRAPTQVAQQQPQRAEPGPALAASAPTTAAPERAIMPAISRIPTSPEVAATFDNKIATAGFDRRTPDAAATQLPPGIKPQASGVAARSDLDYGLNEEEAFQRGIRDTAWYKEYVKKYGEQPDLDSPDYNYRQAWKSGARPDVRDAGDKSFHWPSEFKGPDHPNRFVGGIDTITGQPNAAGRITPQTTTLTARSDPNYVAAPPPSIKWGDELPTTAAAATPPPDVEVTPAERSSAPVELSNDEFKVATPPAEPLPQRLDAGVVGKDALPSEFTSATPQQATPDPLLDAPDVTPRTPLPPDFKVPLPDLAGGTGMAAANAPSWQMPQDMKLPAQLPPPQPPEERMPSTSAPTIQRIRDAIFNGNIPNLSTAPDRAQPQQQPPPPISLQDMQRSIYGAYGSTPRGMRERQEGRTPATTQTPADTSSDERQAQFNEAMRAYVREKLGGDPKDLALQGVRALGMAAHDATPKVIDWIKQKALEYSQPSAPPKQHQAQHPSAPPPAPIRTMPDGRPYIPQGEPLVVPPPKGSTPHNDTLSRGGPTQGGMVIPPAPGQKVNPMTGRPDLLRVPQADGSVQYLTPAEVQQLQLQEQQPQEQQ